ncbi:MAG: RHS repeat protein [Christensenellaceae bacterium]|nr:RHS repeat protein [Christensenellaceae bacterium]
MGDETTTYTYDIVGNRLSMTKGNDTWTYSYDSNDRLLSKRNGTEQTVYVYDVAGNLVQETTGDTAIRYTYNGANQLLQVESGRAAPPKNGVFSLRFFVCRIGEKTPHKSPCFTDNNPTICKRRRFFHESNRNRAPHRRPWPCGGAKGNKKNAEDPGR